MTFIVNNVDGMECVYCGDIATDRDHVIPHSITDKFQRTYKSNEVVPACRECNRFLSNKTLFTIAKRASAITKRLKRKVNKLGSAWTEEEIETLGVSLRAYVISQQHKQRLLVIRLERAEAVSKLANLTPEDYWQSEDQF